MCHLSALGHEGLTQGSWPTDPARIAARFSQSLFVGSQHSHLADQGQVQQLTNGLGQKLLEPEAVESSPPAQPAKEMRALLKCFLNSVCSEIPA